VPSDAPIRVRFDRAVDETSVASRFRLEPGVVGQVTWQGNRELVFEHRPLQPATSYQVVLDPGYRDAQGTVNSLRHSWSFSTEGAPSLIGSSPAAGEGAVDPAAYISLTFSRAMDLRSLAHTVSVSPSVPFSLRQDPSDSRRVILAPGALLEPGQPYTVAVTQDARDAHGNTLRNGSAISFSTDDLRMLKHWVGFVAQPPAAAAGDGVWIVDENRFPRRVVSASVDQFSWSQDGTHVLMRSAAGAWSDQSLSGGATTLPFKADWAAFLAPGKGYVYLDQGALNMLTPSGSVVAVAANVGEASVAPAGARLAFTVTGGTGAEIDGYSVDLRARYRLQSENGPIDQLAWSPDGQSLAYRVAAPDPARTQIRARQLSGAARTLTVAVGEVSGPAWQADSRHLILTAAVPASSGSGGTSGRISKAFRLAVGDPPPATLSAAQGMPGSSGLSVTQVSVSPDGHQVAFLAEYQGLPAVWLMNADGTGLARLTQFDSGGLGYSCRDIAWTPA
jgi:Bacterial Ig-like domain/WD40-like Beta Propeller Repeat